MTILKKILLAVLVIFLLLQFIRPERNVARASQANDIFQHYPASDTVKGIVKKACYDCHSNNTYYPWYINIQPVGLWLQHHVDEGKSELNFSEFASYPKKKASHKLEEAIEQIKDKEMPLTSYTLIHTNAKLSEGERKLVSDWFESLRLSMNAGE